MEKILNENEKFIKAQEIYNRRKNGTVRVLPENSNPLPKPNSKPKLAKLFVQVLLSITVYAVVYVVQHSNYYFSQDFIKKAQDILSYNINFSEIVSTVQNYIQLPNIDMPVVISDQSNNVLNQTSNVLGTTATETPPSDISNNVIITEPSNEQIPTQNASSLNQMKLDSEEIKANYEVILPITGNITSPFGIRDVAPTFHTGLDIARNTGTPILAAMDGIVSINPEESEYGNHLTITNNDLTTLYAHCNKLLVDNGATVTKGQVIAEVGSTGNSSGPHLHFEIIYKNRIVDPEYVLDF